jgi:hypothetical protein
MPSSPFFQTQRKKGKGHLVIDTQISVNTIFGEGLCKVDKFKETKKPPLRKETSGMDLISLTNNTIDWLLRIRGFEVLNDSPPNPLPGNPAQKLRKLTRALKAEAIEEDGKTVHYTYLSMSKTFQQFKTFTSALPLFDLGSLKNSKEQTAFWINLYNALILDAVVSFSIKKSMLSKPSVFRRAAYNVGGYRFSADDIEHGILRGNQPHPVFRVRPFGPTDPRLAAAILEPLDPRIHFALVCGAKSCPPIAFYDPQRLDQQLSQAASNFINGGGVRLDPANHTLWLSKIFKWYQTDFRGLDGIRSLLHRYGQDKDMLAALYSQHTKFKYCPYDWSVNNLA